MAIVTPGVGKGRDDDQARTAGVAEAFSAGADHVVVGRAVRDAPDPRAALERIIAESRKPGPPGG